MNKGCIFVSAITLKKKIEIMTSMQILKSEKLVLNFLSLGADLETAKRLANNEIERENCVKQMFKNSDVFLTKFDGTPLR